MAGASKSAEPATLHSDDQEVLDRFKAEEKIRLEEIEACKEAKAAAQRDLAELKRQMDEDSAELKKDQGALKKDEKSLSKEELEKRRSDLEEKKKKIEQEKSKSKELNKSINRKCRSPLPNSRNCVDKDSKTKMEDALANVADIINKENDTKIDFDALVGQEGAYSGAYVPWWPIPKDKDTYTMTTKYPRSDDPKGTTPVISGDRNHSGVSIGVGIDLGDQKKDVYLKDLDEANQKFKILTDVELVNIKKTIDPYFGKMRSEACAYLRKSPLTLSQKEMDLLHLRASNNAIRIAKNKNDNFKELSVAEQTTIFKKIYNLGR
ncbi:MAG: pesticin C-terminus-like muramidase [Comamonas sp.]